MNTLEDELAALLKAAPGEPPVALDPDELLDTRPPRHRFLAPVLAAAAVAAVAVVVTVFTRSTGPHLNAPTHIGLEAARRDAAVAWVTDALDHAAVPPGATAGHRRVRTYAQTSYVYGTQRWAAPGSIAHAVAYIRKRPPVGLPLNASDPRMLYYDKHGGSRSLQYDVSARTGGVMIKVEAASAWKPVRPAWSYVRGTVSAVEATVVRRSPAGGRFGAPTVRRTLVGAAAGRLAGLLNSLSAQRLLSGSCPGLAIRAQDTLLFHSDGRPVKVTMRQGCDGQASLSEPGRRHDRVYVTGANLDNATLAALGLPHDYGFEPHPSPSASASASQPGGAQLMSRAAAEAFARDAIHAADSAPTFSRLMSVAAFEKTYREPLGTTVDRSHAMWVVTVHAPVTDDGGPARPPQQHDVYSIVIDATTGTGVTDCTGCDWVKADQ